MPVEKRIKLKTIGIGLGLLALLLLGYGLYAQLDSAYPIHITVIVPDDFIGLATIQFSKRGGDSVPVQGRAVTYRIPASGSLKLRDDNPEYRWHIIFARRASGQQLPIGDQNDPQASLPREVVAVWPLRLQGEDSGFFVGTLDQLKEWKTHQDWYIAIHGPPATNPSLK